MKRFLALTLSCGLTITLLTGCGSSPASDSPAPDGEGFVIAATTYPVYLLASAVTEGVDGVTVVPVVNQSMPCLHDYTLTVADMKVLEGADAILLNGAGLEDFMEDAIGSTPTVDCSQGIELLTAAEEHHHEDEEESGHSGGEYDPHIWMDPDRAAQMAENIAAGLASIDPDHAQLYTDNGTAQAQALNEFSDWGRQELSDLSCRDLITFHEGFTYFADAFGLNIVAAIEEEAGSEASAKDISEIVEEIRTHNIPVIFVEQNGSDATAKAIERECGVGVDALTMMMSGPEEYSDTNNYQTYLKQNIETIKEALG